MAEWRIGSVLACILAVVGGSGCAPRVAPAGFEEGAVFGRATVEIQETLDYFIPAEKRQQWIQLSLWRLATGSESDDYQLVTTDRAGYFFRDKLPAGDYRLTALYAPGGPGAGASRRDRIAFPLLESSLSVGRGMNLRRAAPSNVPSAPAEATPTPTAGPPSALELANQVHLELRQARYLGHLVLELRTRPWPASPGCVVRAMPLAGSDGEVYASSTSVHARLCVRDEREDAVKHFGPRLEAVPAASP